MYDYKPIITNKIYIGLSLLLIISIMVLLVVPGFMKTRILDNEIETLTVKRDIQQKLFPLFNQLSLRADFNELPPLNVPDKGMFKRSDIGKISTVFKEFSEQNNLVCEQSMPDVNTLYGNSIKMLVRLELTGELSDFRNFLLLLTRLNYFDSIEEVKILPLVTGKRFLLNVWILIE